MDITDIWTIKIAQSENCPDCSKSEWTTCSHCNGKGTMPDGQPCLVCSGKGKYCTNCAEMAHEEELEGQIDEQRLKKLEAADEELSNLSPHMQGVYHDITLSD